MPPANRRSRLSLYGPALAMPHRFLSVLLILTAAVTAPALEWKTQHVSLKTAPLQKVTETAFEFTNTSEKTVTITSVDSSCDCLDAFPSAKTFAPGASGRINAKFTVGDRSGVYRRTIIVATDENDAPVALTVELDVPEVATLSPRSLEWKLQGPAAEQAVEVEVAPGLALTISHVQGTSDHFIHRLEILEAGRRYRLYLAPKSTAEVANAAFRLYAKAASGEDLVLSVYGNVR
jgi:hypothetical protein